MACKLVMNVGLFIKVQSIGNEDGSAKTFTFESFCLVDVLCEVSKSCMRLYIPMQTGKEEEKAVVHFWTDE